MECYIVSQANPNLVLDVAGGNKGKGGNVIIWELLDLDNQKWIIQDHEIINVNSGKVLDIEGGENSGSKIIQWDSHHGPNQTWSLHPDGTIRSKNGLCLDIRGGKIEKGTPVIAWKSNNGLNQKWRIVPIKSASNSNFGI